MKSMRNLIILPLMVMVLTASCQDVNIKKKIQDKYKQSVQFFENDLVSHFPAELPDCCWFSTTITESDTQEMAGFGVHKFFMTCFLPKYRDIAHQFTNLPNTIYSANDSSLLLIFDYCDILEIDGRKYRNIEPLERQALAKHNVTAASSLPVPLFEIEEYKGNTMSGLTEDFKLYVLDAKPGKYIDKKNMQDCECLPDKWKHDYSKGIAYNNGSNVIIYWIIVW